jgi:hypothetical protein
MRLTWGEVRLSGCAVTETPKRIRAERSVPPLIRRGAKLLKYLFDVFPNKFFISWIA